MDTNVLQQALESLIDWIVSSDSQKVTDYITKLRLNNPQLNNRQIAEKIVNEQSQQNGLLGAITGFGGLVTLPATVPIDLIKSWKIQAFTIRCIACLYGYVPENRDLKTDIFLVLSNGSVVGIKNLVVQEAMNSVSKHSLKALDSLKHSAIEVATKQGTKYAAKAITKYGGKTIVNSTMKGAYKYLVKALWKVGGRKAVEKAVQKSLGKAIPVLGAVIGGGIDWFSTQAVGKLAIQYYENSVNEWVDEVFGLCED